jgi:hypothetical protein
VHRIQFSGNRATGIVVQHQGQLKTVRARKEVILAAGNDRGADFFTGFQAFGKNSRLNKRTYVERLGIESANAQGFHLVFHSKNCPQVPL